MKCNRCNLSIDGTSDAFVTMPNSEQCGYRSRRPTQFAHARCFEKGVIESYEQRKTHERELRAEIEEARKAEEPFGPEWVARKCEENERGFGRKS